MTTTPPDDLVLAVGDYLDLAWPLGEPVRHAAECTLADECLIAAVLDIVAEVRCAPVDAAVANGVRDWLRRREAKWS